MKELTLFLFLLIAVLIILYIPMILKIPELPNLENVSFFSKIRGCAQRENGVAPRENLDEERKPDIIVEGNKVEYSRALNHLCCRMVMVNKKIEGWIIDIYENWGGLGCRCICFSEITATVENLPKGTYTVNVYEGGINTDGTQMTKKVIISKVVTI